VVLLVPIVATLVDVFVYVRSINKPPDQDYSPAALASD
jgi:hypothetical protein